MTDEDKGQLRLGEARGLSHLIHSDWLISSVPDLSGENRPVCILQKL